MVVRTNRRWKSATPRVGRTVAAAAVGILLSWNQAWAQGPEGLQEILGQQSATEFLETLSSIGVSGGAYLPSGGEGAPPRAVPKEASLAATAAVQDLAAVWAAAHPEWHVTVDDTVVVLVAPGLSAAFRQAGDVWLQAATLDHAVNALVSGGSPSAEPVHGGSIDDGTRVTVDARGMTIVAAFNAMVRQAPGTSWIVVRHGAEEDFDRFRLKTSRGDIWRFRSQLQPIEN